VTVAVDTKQTTGSKWKSKAWGVTKIENPVSRMIKDVAMATGAVARIESDEGNAES